MKRSESIFPMRIRTFAIIFLFLTGLAQRLPTAVLQAAPAAAYSITLNMAEPGFETALGTPDIVPLPDGIYLIDVVQPTTINSCSGSSDVTFYEEVQDGTSDLRLTVTTVHSNAWSRSQALWDDTSSNSLRSDWSIAPDTSKPNDYGYIMYNVEFINGLENSVAASAFSLRVTSANGASEAYEWTQVTANGAGAGDITAASIGSYTNDIYNGVSITPARMSEHLSGTTDGGQGGLIRTGWWAIDDFNTTVDPLADEGAGNPASGNGGPSDDQTVDGAELGFSPGNLITEFAVYFGLTDVAYDTSGDGFTDTGSTPKATFTDITIGFDIDSACPTAIELAHFTALAASDNSVQLNWETTAELNHAGFNIYRRSAEIRDDWQLINSQFIASRGQFGGGSTYALVDSNVAPGTWEYLLEDVETDGDQYPHLDQIAVVEIRAPSAVNLKATSIASASSSLPMILLIMLAVTGVLFWKRRPNQQKSADSNQVPAKRVEQVRPHLSVKSSGAGYVKPMIERYSSAEISRSLGQGFTGGNSDPMRSFDPLDPLDLDP